MTSQDPYKSAILDFIIFSVSASLKKDRQHRSANL